MVLARLELNEYANSVLNVVKAKYNLQDKSAAFNKFAEIYGDEFVEREVKDDYVKKLIAVEKRHFAKHGNRKITHEEFNELFELR